MANAINMRNQGELPRKTETNPHEHVKAITLRSGKELSEPTKERKEEQVEGNKDENDEEAEDKKGDERRNSNSSSSSSLSSKIEQAKG